eukprot:3306005-Prymnesium_polylepis.1
MRPHVANLVGRQTVLGGCDVRVHRMFRRRRSAIWSQQSQTWSSSPAAQVSALFEELCFIVFRWYRWQSPAPQLCPSACLTLLRGLASGPELCVSEERACPTSCLRPLHSPLSRNASTTETIVGC